MSSIQVLNELGRRLKEGFSLIRLTSFDTSTTPGGQSTERFRRIALTFIAGAAAKAVGIVTSIISVPLTLSYLGSERYGLWLAASSFTIFLGFTDLGVGNGLINAISEANGRDDRILAREYVSSAFFILLAIAVGLGIAFGLLYPCIDWSRFFNVSSAVLMPEVGPTVAILFGCFLVSFPVGIVQRVQMGYQEGFIDSSWQCLGSILSLGTLILAIHFGADLPLLVLAVAGAPLLGTLVNGVVLFGVRRPWIFPRFRFVRLGTAGRILKLGLLYFVLGVAGALGFQSDNMVIAYFLGADHVPQYAVPMKLFMMIPMLLSFVLTPLWPAYGEAMARKDLKWVRVTFKRSLGLCFAVTVPGAVVLILFGSWILRVWVGNSINPPRILLLGLGVWVVVTSVGGAFAMFLNGLTIIGFQVVCAMLMGISNLALSIFLVRKIGVAGPVFASITACMVFGWLASALYIRRLFGAWVKQT